MDFQLLGGRRCRRGGTATGKAGRSHPVYAEQRAGLAEDADDLLDLAMAHPLADATKHHQSPWLEGWVVLECKP